MNDISDRGSRVVLGAVISFSLVVMFFFVWLFWPYPKVTSQGAPVLMNKPANGIYVTGDVVSWTTPEVCQPGGITEVNIVARLRFPLKNGRELTVETPTVEYAFNVPDGYPKCVKNNQTSMFVSGNMPTGLYELEIRACVLNPTPRPRCSTTSGPDINVYRPDKFVIGELRIPPTEVG